ncbi:MAG TPA: Uma2 family endonuclease [Verrucomicrobiae bacterium]|jgi:Uma2 family endonuclease|nr:Uma2 family endonuclease [Verrucomicrobiae bacterium]
MKTLTISEASRWENLCDDPSLENIPYRVELSRHGQLITSPHQSYHSIFQSRIIRALIQLLPQGEAMPECPIETDEGIFVADVAWASSEKVERNFNLAMWSESPDIVIEVLSPSNSDEEVRIKRNAVFAKGATEFCCVTATERFNFSAAAAFSQSPVFAPNSPPASAKPLRKNKTSLALTALEPPQPLPAPPTYCAL